MRVPFEHFTKTILPVGVLAFSSCNFTDTKIGDDYHPGIYISAENSLVGVSSSSVVSGTSATFTLTLKDQNFNPFVGYLPVVSFYVSGGTSTGTIGSVTNQLDGTYTANFLAGLAGTATTVHALVDGQEIRSPLPTLTVASALVPFTQSWPFDFGTTASYAYDTGKIDFTGGVCRLSSTDQVDDENSSSGFGGGSLSGAAFWDGANSYLRLGSNPPDLELDSDWAPARSNLMGYWKLDEPAGTAGAGSVVDSSGAASPVDGTPAHVTFGGAGKVGTAAAFDGATSCVDFGDKLDLSGTGLSISAWIKPASVPQTTAAGIFTKLSSFGNYRLTVAGDSVDFGIRDAANTFQHFSTAAGAISAGQWTHVLATYDNGSTGILYLNGQLATKYTGFTIARSAAPTSLYIGCNPNNVAYFSGSIDDVAVWNAVLSPTAVAAIYQHQSSAHAGTLTSRIMDGLSNGASWTTLSWKPTLPFMKELPATNEAHADYSGTVTSTAASGDSSLANGLTGLWHLDESVRTAGAANDFQDSSGAGHSLESGGAALPGFAGRLGGAVKFDATATSYLGSSAAIGNRPPYTACAWINPTTLTPGTVGTIVNTGQGIVNRTGFSLVLNTNKTVTFYIEDNSLMVTGGATSGAIAPGWNMVCGSWDGTAAANKIVVYERGIARGTGNVNASAIPGPILNSLVVGANAGLANRFNGLVDEVAVWSRVLDPKEIFELYRRGANRIEYQVRNCAAADCSDDATGANWKGPDGTNQTYFSELNNNTVPLDGSGSVKATLPSILFSGFTAPIGTSRYFQYRAILESDDTGTGCNYGSGATWCGPELKSVAVDPVHFDASAPTVIGKTGVSFDSLASLAETLGAACASGIGYDLGVGAAYSSATWYWWDAAANAGAGGWASADGTVGNSNDAATITLHAAAFGTAVGTGTVYFKAFLKSSGTSPCELDHLDLSGQH